MRAIILSLLFLASTASGWAQQSPARKTADREFLDKPLTRVQREAEVILSKAVECKTGLNPSGILKSLIRLRAIEARPFDAPDSVNYFRPRVKMQIGNLNVTAVIAFDDEGFKYDRTPGSVPGRLIGFSTDAPRSSAESWKSSSKLDVWLNESMALRDSKDVICSLSSG
jgi:hypothetical protein